MITKLHRHHFLRDDGLHFHLGRKCILRDSRTLQLARYLTPANLPPLAPSTNWSTSIPDADLPMDLNDRLGDCVVAGLAHLVTVATFNTGKVVVPTEDQVIDMYAYSGYVPGDPSTDQGWTLLDGAKYVQSEGLAGVTALAFAEVDPQIVDMVRYSVQLFGGCNTGVRLPQSAMDAFGKGTWDDTNDTNILGGHDLPIVDYNTTGPVYWTWGARQQATWAWHLQYCDEAMALIFDPWAQGISPSGFDRAALEADLAAIKG